MALRAMARTIRGFCEDGDGLPMAMHQKAFPQEVRQYLEKTDRRLRANAKRCDQAAKKLEQM